MMNTQSVSYRTSRPLAMRVKSTKLVDGVLQDWGAIVLLLDVPPRLTDLKLRFSRYYARHMYIANISIGSIPEYHPAQNWNVATPCVSRIVRPHQCDNSVIGEIH